MSETETKWNAKKFNKRREEITVIITNKKILYCKYVCM